MSVRGRAPAPGASPTGANEGLFGIFQAFVRSPQFAPLVRQQLGLGNIGARSSSTPPSGLDISSVNRGLLGPLIPNQNYTSITATTFTVVDATKLAGTLMCTGRPVMLLFGATVTKGTNAIWLSMTMDGTEVTGHSFGMAATATAGTQWLVGWWILTPAAGPHLFALVARVDAGTGQVLGDSGNMTLMAALEL